MERKALKSVILLALFVLFSCKETVVTNIVHKDGSVTRMIVTKDTEKKSIYTENCCVPCDNTWSIKDSFELKNEGDTTWVRTAKKLFKNVEEINKEYSNDTGVNQNFEREARFSKKFRWFNTTYTFSENIDKSFSYGYPIGQYLNKQELEYFFMPENLLNDRRNGPDSLLVKQMEDTVKYKSEKWVEMCLISEWKGEFLKLAGQKGFGDKNIEFLKDKDSLIYSMLEKAEKDSKFNYDSVFIAIMKVVFGDEMYLVYKPELDSSIKILENRFATASSFEGYTMKTRMPGKIIDNNGFMGQNEEIEWPVKMEFFLTQPYQMWAVSKISNTWAWAVSGVFVLFVVTGLIMRMRRNGNI